LIRSQHHFIMKGGRNTIAALHFSSRQASGAELRSAPGAVRRNAWGGVCLRQGSCTSLPFLWQSSFYGPPLDLRLHNLKNEASMRSELVYSANVKIENRFLLASVTMKAVKSLHIASTRTEDTANSVLREIATGKYLEVQPPPIKPAPPIDLLPISAA